MAQGSVDDDRGLGAAGDAREGTESSVVSELDWLETPLPSLMRLAWPIVVSMLSHSVMTLVDTFFVSRLGSWALAGVGLGGISSFVLLCFPIGLLGAVKILGSQAVGAGRRERVQSYMAAGMLLSVVLGLTSMALASLLVGQMPALSAGAETADAAQTYLGINLLAMVPILLRISVEQARMATGDSQSPMRVTIFANAINISLDYVFIIMLGWGVAGAAYATLVANIVACIAMFGIQAKDGFELRSMRWQHLKSVWRIGVPTGLQFGLELGSYAVMVVMLTRLSELDAAANQIAIQVIHFGFLPCFAVGDAVSIMVGQAVGARRRDLIEVLTRSALIPALAYASAATLVFGLAGRVLASGFTEDPALLEMTTHLFWVAALFQITDAINMIARGVLRGTGDVNYCAWMGIFLSWLMTPTLTWLFGYHYGLGALGGWIGMLILVSISALVFWMRLRSGRWHLSADRSLGALHSEQ